MTDVRHIMYRAREMVDACPDNECATFMLCAKCHLIVQIFRDVAEMIWYDMRDSPLDLMLELYMHIGEAPRDQIVSNIDRFLCDVDDVWHEVKVNHQLLIPV